MGTTTYTVPGVHCDHCVHALQTEIGEVAGVTAVTVDLDAKTVTVEGEADGEAVLEAIDEAGYEVA